MAARETLGKQTIIVLPTPISTSGDATFRRRGPERSHLVRPTGLSLQAETVCPAVVA